MGTLLFLFLMAICVGMVVYGVVTFTVRLRRQRRRRASASERLDPADIEVMARPTSAPAPEGGSESGFESGSESEPTSTQRTGQVL